MTYLFKSSNSSFIFDFDGNIRQAIRISFIGKTGQILVEKSEKRSGYLQIYNPKQII